MSASSASPPPSPADAPAAAPARRRPRWKKIALTLAGLTVVATLGLTLAAWHLWTRRASYAQQSLQHFLPDFTPSLGTLDLTSTDFQFTDLALTDPETQKPFASLQSAKLSAWRQTLRSRTLGRLELRGLRLATTTERLPALLAAFLPKSPALAPAPTQSSPFLPQVSIEGIDLTDLRVDLQGGPTQPHLAFTLDHHLDQIQINAAGIPSLKETRLHLRDLLLRSPDGSTLTLPHLDLQAAFDPDTGILHLHHIRFPDPLDLSLLPTLGAFIQSLLAPPDTSPTAWPPWFKGITIDAASLPSLRLDASQGLPSGFGLPLILVTAETSYEARDIAWTVKEGLKHPGTHDLRLAKVQLKPLNAQPGHLLFPDLILQASQNPATAAWEIQDLSATTPDIHWTPELESALLGPASSPLPSPSTASTSPPLPVLHLTTLALVNARFRLQPTPRVPFTFQSSIDLHAKDLHLADRKLSSSQPQRLLLRQIQTEIPGSRTAAPTTVESIEAVIRPDHLFASGLIDRLHIVKPRLAYHLDLNALAKTTTPPSPNPSPSSSPFDLPPPFDLIHFTHLAIAEGTVHVDGKWGAPFAAETTFTLTTQTPDTPGTAGSHHTLTIAETRVLATDKTPLPIARVGQFEIQARLPRLLNDRRLESLILTGGQIEFGEALTGILDSGTPTQSPTRTAGLYSRPLPLPNTPDSPTPPSPAQPAPSPKPAPTPAPIGKKWTAAKLAVSDLSITLQKIAPGLPPLTFDVQFEVLDTPLEPAGLVENVKAQRIELSSLTIPAPYGSLRPVARLDTIFIHFTLDDLLRQRIGRVEIVNPTLYVGEPLFWYVDYYRKFAAGGLKTGTDVPGLVLAATGNDLALATASQAIASPPAPAWTLDELQVHAGKLILAPKGVPIPGFRQPFPFSFNTKVGSGQFDAVFDIPADNYPIEQLKLEFLGMRGQVRFNMPLKDVDNNLTETFWVDQIRWKQLHLEKAHLSVTYDMNGIYGKFGGEAYEGYLEGGFDIFNNDSYTWDGWIAATNVRSTEITEKLTPAYFLLDGKINGTLIATGDAKELYQADIKFSNATPGQFSIAGLNSMLEDLPPAARASLTKQITRVGLETLRDFEYDTVEGQARLHGREGKGHLKIIGPSGSRTIEVNVLDHRWKVDPPPPVTTDN